MMADRGDIEGVEDLELVEKPFFDLFIEDILYPSLYSPIGRLDTFIDDNRHLFTLIGVFGAVAVYLQTVENEINAEMGELGNIAVVSGLLLVVLMSVIVMVKLVITVIRAGTWDGMGLIVFGTLFVTLILAITGLMSAFSVALSIYYVLIVYSAGIITGTAAVRLITIIGFYGDSYWDLDIPIVSGAVHFLAVLGFSYFIEMTSYLDGNGWASQPTPPLTLGQWFDLYLELSLAMGGFLLYVLFALYLLLTIVLGLGYLVVGFVSRLQNRL